MTQIWVKDLMPVVNERTTVKLEYKRVFVDSANRKRTIRSIITVPHINDNIDPCFIYPFKSKEEIYDAEICEMEVRYDEIAKEGFIYIISDYMIIEKE